MFKGLALFYIVNSITHRVTPFLRFNHMISLCGVKTLLAVPDPFEPGLNRVNIDDFLISYS